MKKLLLLAMLVSCEGRCDSTDAVQDVAGPTATCAWEAGRAFCLFYDGQVSTCTTDGIFMHTARCRVIGRMAPLDSEKH